MKRRILTALLAFVFFSAQLPAAAFAESGRSFAVVDITRMDIKELQQAVDDGKLTYKQIMTLYLERIEEYGEMYGCLISVSGAALAEAEKCDEIYEKHGRTSDIFGLPIIVKDNINAAGMATTNGDSSLSGNVAAEDAEVVASLKEAGGIIVAKANMDSYAEHSQYSVSDYGRVNNAFDLSRTSYGSSGGSAVSAAASLAPICIGTDTNASIRVPASANGVVGIRPTKGLLSARGITVCMGDRDTAGPMARTVEDAAIILSAMNGFETDYTEYLSCDDLKGMKIGVATRLSAGLSSDVRKLFDNALKLLEKQGAEIVRINFPLAPSWDCSVASYRSVFTAAMDRHGVDLVVYPTIRSAVMTHGAAASSGGNSNGWYIAPAAGAPAMTVPAGLDSSGLPVGVEFAGRGYDEASVITAGYALEQALDLDIHTSLAPSLYESPEEVEELLEFCEEEEIFGRIRSYDNGYGEVEKAYEAIVAYSDSEYYRDDNAPEESSSLMAAYDAAVKDYKEAYEKYKATVILGVCVSAAAMIAVITILIVRHKKKSAV